jgi:hypothetical protein
MKSYLYKPLGKDKLMRHPVLYKKAPDVLSDYVKEALMGLKEDFKFLHPVIYDQLNAMVDKWFPVFKE